MNLSISLAGKTCHNRIPATLLPAIRMTRGKAMAPSDRNSLKQTDLSQAEMIRLLGIVGRDRKVEAFEILFRHYSPRIRSFMTIKTKDRQVAEELMQETMVSVWNKASQFDPDRGNVSAWIFTIARNIRIDAYRRNRPVFDP